MKIKTSIKDKYITSNEHLICKKRQKFMFGKSDKLTVSKIIYQLTKQTPEFKVIAKRQKKGRVH